MLISRQRSSATQAFTIIEVMMASVILVVGFMGMIQAITMGSEMMATARRQTLSARILEHEIGKLRLASWTAVSALTDTSEIEYTTLTPEDTTFDTAIAASGVTFNLSRDVTVVTNSLVEVTFAITWTKSGSNAAATTPSGSWLDKLSFYRPSSASRTYTRKATAFFGKYGLNNSIQRS